MAPGVMYVFVVWFGRLKKWMCSTSRVLAFDVGGCAFA